MNIKEEVNKYKDYTIALRREFHANPESALNEFKTVKRIERELNFIGIPYEIVGETGILAKIEGKKKGKTVALRADIDALKMDDLKDVSYRSKKPGLCHCCGHDGHTAMLITAGRILFENIDKVNGSILLIFQPAEESAAGARKMLEDKNILQGVDSILGIHLLTTMEIGTVGYTYGASHSSADSFTIELKGKGGHAAMPHGAIDPLVAACALVTDAQHIISREIAPSEFGVLTFGAIHSGTRSNIIPDKALIKGTIRAFDEDVRKTIKNGLKRVAKSCADAYRTEMTMKFHTETYPIINTKEHIDIARRSMEKLFDQGKIIEKPRHSASDDFSHYLQKVPGLYLTIGAGNKEKGITYPHHHPKFDIDEDALENGTALHIQYAMDFL